MIIRAVILCCLNVIERRRLFMKKIISLAVMMLALFAAGACAVPANSQRIFVLKQPDGTTFNARVCGDERCHWTETAKGAYAIVQQDGRWMFARIKDGMLQPSRVQYGDRVKPPKCAVKRFRPADLKKNDKPCQQNGPCDPKCGSQPPCKNAPCGGGQCPDKPCQDQ